MQKDSNDLDALTIVMMSHFLGKNITLLSGKADKWSTEIEHGCGHSAAVQRGQCLLSHGCRYIHLIQTFVFLCNWFCLSCTEAVRTS